MKRSFKRFFEKSDTGLFMKKNGIWKTKAEGQRILNKYFKHHNKLCLYSTNQEELAIALYNISKLKECYAVKYLSKKRAGMYLGRAYIAEEKTIGNLWAKYYNHPKFMCTIQNDMYVYKYRKLIKDRWK